MINVSRRQKLVEGVDTASSFMMLYVHRNHVAYLGQGKNGIVNESPGPPPPCSHSSWALHTVFSFMVLYFHRNRMADSGQGKNGIGNETPGPPPCWHSSWALIWAPSSSSMMLYVHRNHRDGGRLGQGMRTQAHLPVNTAPELCHPSSSSSLMVLYVHRNRMAY